MQVEIRKGKGIESLVGCVPVDEARQIAEARLFKEVETAYRKQLDEKFSWIYHTHPVLPQVLTPEQINAFLQTTMRYEEHRLYAHNTGYLISRLIQNSYDDGHNSFTLDTTALKKIAGIGRGLEGTSNDPIEIEVVGNTGEGCGSMAIYASFNITGNTGDSCGFASENSAFNIQGSTRSYCGFLSIDSTFNIQGNTGHSYGWGAENLAFNISGNTGRYYGSHPKRSTYKTSNEETLKKMLRDVPRGNRIIFIDGGRERPRRL